MSIRYTTIVFATIVLCVFSFASYMISKSVIVDGFEAIENEQTVTDSLRAVNALNGVINYLDRLLVDWAYWDDSYAFVQDRNEGFIKSNLTVETFIKQNVAFVIFLDNDGEIIWGMQVDAERRAFTSLSPDMRLSIIRPTPLLLDDQLKDVSKGVLILDGSPFILSSRRILDSDATKHPKGVCIMGRRLDHALIEELGSSTQLNLNIRLLTQEESEALLPIQPKGGPSLVKDETSIFAGTIFRNLYGVPSLELVVKDDRSVMAMGLTTFKHNFFWMLATGISVGAVFTILMEVRILRRIRIIRAQADRICQSGETAREIIIDGKDEISGLAENINHMLAKIVSDEAFLRQTLDSLQAGVILIAPEDHRIVDLNSFALKLIGLSKEELVDKVCHGFICPQEVGNCPITDKHQRIDLSVKRILTKGNTSKSILKSVSKVYRGGRELLLETFIDISDLEAAQQALQFTEDKYRTVFMNTGTASILIDKDMTIVLANMEFSKLSGFDRADIENRMTFTEFIAFEQRNRLMHYHRQRRVDPEYAPRVYETVFVDKNNNRLDVHMTVAMIPGTDFSIASVLDISDRIRAEKQIVHQAFHDSLTGLPNRALLHDRLQHALHIAAREKSLVGVLLLDLDRFKQVNDSFGHSYGDKLLRQVAERLSHTVRSKDTVARLGGDEFVIVLENIKDISNLIHAAHNILSIMRMPFNVDEHLVYISVSIGITNYPHDGSDHDSLIKNADLAMYRSKESGKNTYSMFTKELNDQVMSRMALETELHRALDNNSFFVVYQPKINALTNAIVGCEALVRWRNLAGEIVPPAAFIHVAEEMGLIVQLDAWVLKNACLQVRRWHELGASDLVLAVNISARSFQSDSITEQVIDILRESSFPPHLLEIEITETVLMSNWEKALEAITTFSRMGIRISLDDFGTGYSSLSYLQKLPINTLKIDKRFVDGIGNMESDSTVLVKTIITLADSLSLAIVAEGVETLEQLNFLLDNRCNFIQGYLFSPPLTPDRLESLLGKSLSPGSSANSG